MSNEMEKLRQREVENFFKHPNQQPSPSWSQTPKMTGSGSGLMKWVIVAVILGGMGQCFNSMTLTQDQSQPSHEKYSQPLE